MSEPISATPLKRYHLLCPKCQVETIQLPAATPESPYCPECEEEIDIDDLAAFIESWLEYLKDRAALLEQEAKGDASCKP